MTAPDPSGERAARQTHSIFTIMKWSPRRVRHIVFVVVAVGGPPFLNLFIRSAVLADTITALCALVVELWLGA